MSSVEIPGKPPRWGNESTNFYQASFTRRPGSASAFKVYRCHGSVYTNPGHVHVGTKALNSVHPMDKFGTPAAHKLRAEDQRLPRALMTTEVHQRRLSVDAGVDLYQSHNYHTPNFAMAKTRPSSAGPSMSIQSSVSSESRARPTDVHPSAPDPLLQALNRSFYVTSYQKHMSLPQALPAASTTRARPQVVRSRSFSEPGHLTSLMLTSPSEALGLQNPRQPLPSKGEMLKEVFSKYPSPQSNAASQWNQRPSSAASLRAGKIPNLR